MSKEIKEIESLFSIDKEISFGKDKVKIKQIEFGSIPQIVNLVVNVLGEIPDLKDKKQTGVLIARAMAADFASVVNLLSQMTDLDEEKIKRMNLAATVKIFSVIIEENIDFLFQTVMPEVHRMVEGLNKQAGFLKSKDSSSTGTVKKK